MNELETDHKIEVATRYQKYFLLSDSFFDFYIETLHPSGEQIKKLQGNLERDKRNQKSLTEMGWRVIVIWECAISKKEVINKILTSIRDM